LIAVAAACLYLLVSLLSYSDADPGWSATGNGGAVRNLGGPTGAWLSDVCFSLVGYLAYLFP
jgi:S-DNA-T family DNA segregation ATPase FtsK/SpoIIIE